jgi:hypothetical protein
MEIYIVYQKYEFFAQATILCIYSNILSANERCQSENEKALLEQTNWIKYYVVQMDVLS